MSGHSRAVRRYAGKQLKSANGLVDRHASTFKRSAAEIRCEAQQLGNLWKIYHLGYPMFGRKQVCRERNAGIFAMPTGVAFTMPSLLAMLSSAEIAAST